MKILKICLISALSIGCVSPQLPHEDSYKKKILLTRKLYIQKKHQTKQNLFRIFITSKKTSSYALSFLMLKKTANDLGCDDLEKIVITKKRTGANCIKFVSNNK